MIDVKEILDKHGAYWVSKLDNKKSIDCENAKEAIKEIVTEVLKEAANDIKMDYTPDITKNVTHKIRFMREEGKKWEINKESITSVIDKVKF